MEFAAVARALKDEIIERTKEYLAVHGPKAAGIFIAALNDGPNVPGVKERLLAAREILDRSGVIKTEQITIDTPGTLFILPPKDIPPSLLHGNALLPWNETNRFADGDMVTKLFAPIRRDEATVDKLSELEGPR